jgi:predicted GNAT family N-acyltransferase
MPVDITATPTQAELDRAFQLRHEIFIQEAERDRIVETDEHDATATHFVALQNGEVVATLRAYLLNPEDKDLKIGRVAVRQDLRGQGLGAELMNFATTWAFGQGYPSVYLHAESKVAGFYEKLGFLREGEEFMEAGTGHVRMRLRAAP